MGKVNKAAPVRAGQTVKAGKKKSYKEPPAPNPEKRRRSEAGRQQFFTDVQLTEPAIKTVFNKKTQQFEEKLYDAPVPFIWDENRRQFVYGPSKENKER